MIEITSVTEIVKHIHDIKAVIFDLDDTLYAEKEYIRSGYRAIANSMPYVNQMEEKLWQAFLQNKFAIDEVLKAEGIYSEELKQKCLSVYRFHQPDIHFYDGVSELLRMLSLKGYKLGIITDGRPEGQRAKIKALHLDKFVDCIIITDEMGGVKYRKPNKAAFVKMKDMLGVEFEDMCYIGDNIQKDFIAPEMLNIKSICLKNIDGLYFKKKT